MKNVIDVIEKIFLFYFNNVMFIIYFINLFILL